MSDNRDEKLDKLLRSRRAEPASPDLAQRVILAAQRLRQNKTVPLCIGSVSCSRNFICQSPLTFSRVL